MPTGPAIDPVARRFRDAVCKAYGDRIERVVLFGSRARGGAREDSDYDMAVFIKDYGDVHHELGRLSEISTEILLDTGAVISARPFIAGS